MAAIAITVNDDLYTIKLDVWEWTSLTVNNQSIQKGADGWYTYVQESEGLVDFTATANYLVTLNPTGNNFLMSSDDVNNTHLASLTYTPEGVPFEISGVLCNVGKRSNSQPGPFAFNQGKMTGTFAQG